MVRVKRVVLQFLISILLSINVNVSTASVVGVVSGPQKGWQYNSPLILVLKGSYAKHYDKHDHLRTSGNQNLVAKYLHDKLDLKKSVQIVKDIVESTGNKNDPAVVQIKEKFKEALRSQCEKYVKCTITCKVKKKHKQKDCQKSCKEVYDYLMMCHPPAGVKKDGITGSTKGPKNANSKESCEWPDDCEPKPTRPNPKPTTKKDSCEWSDDCKIKDTCESSDECRPKPTRPEPKPTRPKPKPTTKKDSCEWSDECRIIDTCESSDDCKPKPTRPKPKPTRPRGKGKTMPPKWRL